ncbi:MAG: 4Fe-4S dicluster domain-containing protein [Pseudomonadota bacterium]
MLDIDGLAGLIDALKRDGYDVLGPTVRDGAIVYDHLSGIEALPQGWRDEQAPGHYRLHPQPDDPRLFDHTVGPHSWKRFLHPASESQVRVIRSPDGALRFESSAPTPTPTALIGVRACELAAMAIQDRVLAGAAHPDRAFEARCAASFIIAVQCARAGGTCFCADMGAGPRAEAGYDLALTEILEPGGAIIWHVESGSPRGAALLSQLGVPAAQPTDQEAAARVWAGTRAQMTARMPAAGLRELLYRKLEHPHWESLASRCLACGNCTAVCPTCYCTRVVDEVAIDGSAAERRQEWESCFNPEFSHLPGGSVRGSIGARYRQWITHKLASWHDQFGTSGCVGCGRCISWCPVGIDITAEVAALRAASMQDVPGHLE